MGEEELSWNAELYQSRHSFVWQFGQDLIAILDPKAGEHILDVGCGTGQLTARIAQSGAWVTGLDRSPEMIARARENYPSIAWIAADIMNYRADRGYDAVFSNAALHWVNDADQAVRNIGAALRPGGRFVAEFGGSGNIRTLLAALKDLTGIANPWYFPTVGEYAPLLEKHGFEVRQAALFDRPTPLEDPERGLRQWVEMFGQGWPQDESFFTAFEERLRPLLFRQGQWWIDYRRLRICAFRT